MKFNKLYSTIDVDDGSCLAFESADYNDWPYYAINGSDGVLAFYGLATNSNEWECL